MTEETQFPGFMFPGHNDIFVLIIYSYLKLRLNISIGATALPCFWFIILKITIMSPRSLLYFGVGKPNWTSRLKGKIV